MKAFLSRELQHLAPYRKAASQLRFKDGTFSERLEGQLRRAGLDIREADDPARIEPRSLVLSDNLVLSDSFLKRLLAAIPDPSRSYQVEIESGRFPMLASKSAPPLWKKLPIRYQGDGALELEPLRLQPRPVFELEQGLPRRMQQLTDITVFFFDIFGVAIDHWFDLLSASSLCCREFVAKLIGPFHGCVPAPILSRFTGSSWLMSKFNSIGRNCTIHPTAILEGCIVGDGVDIGPFSYLRSSVIGDKAVVRERSTIKMCHLGPGAFIMGSDLVNSYIGAETAIFAPMLYNVAFGERGFLSGGSGFADFIVGSASIPATIEGKQIPSGLPFLGSGVGDDCFIGANLVFAPGRTIPDGTRLLDHGLIKAVPTKLDGTYVLSGRDLIQIPDGFSKRSAT